MKALETSTDTLDPFQVVVSAFAPLNEDDDD